MESSGSNWIGANGSAQEMTGTAAREGIGKVCSELVGSGSYRQQGLGQDISAADRSLAERSG